jgi:hypothetical protein
MTHEPDRALGVALGGLMALVAAMGIGRFVYTPILPFMVDGLGLSKPAAGVIARPIFWVTSSVRLPPQVRLWRAGGGAG